MRKVYIGLISRKMNKQINKFHCFVRCCTGWTPGQCALVCVVMWNLKWNLWVWHYVTQKGISICWWWCCCCLHVKGSVFSLVQRIPSSKSLDKSGHGDSGVIGLTPSRHAVVSITRVSTVCSVHDLMCPRPTVSTLGLRCPHIHSYPPTLILNPNPEPKPGQSGQWTEWTDSLSSVHHSSQFDSFPVCACALIFFLSLPLRVTIIIIFIILLQYHWPLGLLFLWEGGHVIFDPVVCTKAGRWMYLQFDALANRPRLCMCNMFMKNERVDCIQVITHIFIIYSAVSASKANRSGAVSIHQS